MTIRVRQYVDYCVYIVEVNTNPSVLVIAVVRGLVGEDLILTPFVHFQQFQPVPLARK
jgi:hypothetical protein